MSNQNRRTSVFTTALMLAAVLLTACGPAAAPSPSPIPSARPTPTPIAAPVTTPADAAARVIAANPIFNGAVPLTQDLIGASKWWVATPLAGGGFTIQLTVGWGDCPAGCINRHVWTFDVKADGILALTSETGDPVPNPLPG